MKFKKEDIKLLLDNYFVEPSQNYTKKRQESAEDVEVEADLSVIEFSNNQINSIRKLFVQLSPSEKEQCKNYLLEFITDKTNAIYLNTSLSALIHLGFFDEIFQILTAMKKDSSFNKNFYINIFNTISEILKNEWNIFTRDQIDVLYEWVDKSIDGQTKVGKEWREWSNLYKDVTNALWSLWEKLNIIKTLSLKQEIFSETSQEITTDEKALKLEFKRNNFPDYLSEALDRIDIKISDANDNFDYKDCMGLIRSFGESMFKYVSESLDSNEGRNIDEKDSKSITKFFVDKKLISTDQGELLKALMHFLSNEGVHRLKSRPDDARLSRNMMIEVGLYMLLRLRDIKQ